MAAETVCHKCGHNRGLHPVEVSTTHLNGRCKWYGTPGEDAGYRVKRVLNCECSAFVPSELAGCWCGFAPATHQPGLLRMAGAPYHAYGEKKPAEPDTYEKLHGRVVELVSDLERPYEPGLDRPTAKGIARRIRLDVLKEKT